MHALRLRDVLRAHGDDPRALVAGFDRADGSRDRAVVPRADCRRPARFAEMEAMREGREAGAARQSSSRGALAASCRRWPRPRSVPLACVCRYIGTVTPVQEILERPEVVQRMAAAREALKDTPRPRRTGPSRRSTPSDRCLTPLPTGS